jgi:hypothetical protein
MAVVTLIVGPVPILVRSTQEHSGSYTTALVLLVIGSVVLCGIALLLPSYPRRWTRGDRGWGPATPHVEKVEPAD